MDEELFDYIHRAKQGDRDAFTKLVERYKDQVFRHAVGMLGDRMEAEDVSQEAFIKAFYSISNLEHKYAFTSWMIRIVSNLCKDRLKQRGKIVYADESIIRGEQLGYVESHENLTIEEAMNRLTIEQREVVLLHDVQGFRYEEISEMVGVPLGTVKSRLFSARLALRKELRKGDM
ncbi:MAG: sigma-70 family RNA polymerase sigma factor [Paenibacillaceae bacterium]